MKKLSFLVLMLGTFLYFSCDTTKKTAGSSSDAMAKTGELTTGGTIGFEAANQNYEAKGNFKKWHFTNVKMDKKNVETLSASLAIDLTSIWEKSPKLVDHLKASDFFDMAKYTTATIDIANVKKKSDNKYTADLVLKMKGKTQNMTSDFIVTNKNPLHVTGTAMVDRNLFGLGGNGFGLSDFVKVTYDTDLP